MEQKNSFEKSERLCSKLLIDQLFGEGSESFSIYPIRTVYRLIERPSKTPVSILISVGKRRFKRAVKRNRIKRQLREAYRLHKQIVWRAVEEYNYANKSSLHLTIAFIWLSEQECNSKKIEEKMIILLQRMAESLHTYSDKL